MSALFVEYRGVLSPGLNSGHPPEGKVVLSSLSSGASDIRPRPTFGLKYVAAGREIYSYGGRSYPVTAGQFLLVPEDNGGEVEIGRSDAAAALGLCVYLPQTEPQSFPIVDRPMLFAAGASALGKILTASHSRLSRAPAGRRDIANSLVKTLSGQLEPLLEDTARQLHALDALKSSTRYENLRRLNIARAYLHEVTDRPVELAELAAVAGISRFHLLRNFRSCFGLPPASYHRKIRLELAREALERNRLACGEAAHRYGFADSSSFSHAYRRAFGESPRHCRPRKAAKLQRVHP